MYDCPQPNHPRSLRLDGCDQVNRIQPISKPIPLLAICRRG
ncbi:MAG: hypothetical protein ACNA8H_03415 [Anaerolineales bacterium]